MEIIRLLRGTFVSQWYLSRICPSVTEIQHYYHARYPTDDSHLAYMFSLVYCFVEACLKACFPIPLALGEIPASGSVHLSRCPPPPRIQNRTAVTRLSTWAKWGGISTDAWVCLHYWVVIWVAGYSNFPFIAPFMGCVRIHYGLKVVFCFRHFTASHDHHYARLCWIHVNACRAYLVELYLTCC